MKKKNKAIYLLFLMPFVYFATACFVMWLVKTRGIYPSGILYIILCGITAWRF